MRPRLGALNVRRVLPPPEGRMSVISALRIAILSMTVPENSSSTSMTTVSYGSSRPLGPSRDSTRWGVGGGWGWLGGGVLGGVGGGGGGGGVGGGGGDGGG